MSTRDVSTSTFVGNAGAATLTIQVSLSGSNSFSSFNETYDSLLNTYSPRLSRFFDFSSAATAQSWAPDANTRFVIIWPPAGSTVTWQIGTSSSLTDCVVNRANCPIVFGCNGTTTLYLKPSGTTAGRVRVMEF